MNQPFHLVIAGKPHDGLNPRFPVNSLCSCCNTLAINILNRMMTYRHSSRVALMMARVVIPALRAVLAGIKMKSGNRGIGLNLLAVALAAGVLSGCGQKEAALPAAPPATANSTTQPAVAATHPEFQKLIGKWLRPDGGYILEIRSVTSDGKLEAGYFNPRPINVSKAQATREGDQTKVFVELRDVNYPGSTYTLLYVPQNDQLSGTYYQALQQQRFEVVFVRSN